MKALGRKTISWHKLSRKKAVLLNPVCRLGLKLRVKTAQAVMCCHPGLSFSQKRAWHSHVHTARASSDYCYSKLFSVSLTFYVLFWQYVCACEAIQRSPLPMSKVKHRIWGLLSAHVWFLFIAKITNAHKHIVTKTYDLHLLAIWLVVNKR